MPADYSRIHRLLKIITLVQGGNYNAEKLAKACDATDRSIYRDLNVIAAAGIPCRFDEATKKYVIESDFFLPPVQMTIDEALAVIALGEQVGKGEQVPHLRPALSAAQKLRSQLPPEMREQIGKSAGKVSIRLAAANPPEATESVFTRILQAIESHTVLDVAYESLTSGRGGKPASGPFKLKPYELMFNQRAWYVLGHSSRHDAVRSFKLSRFIRVVPTEQTFEPPKNWSAEKHLGNAWRMIRGDRRHDVELVFDAEFAETVSDTRWHRTQTTEENEDGSMTFKCVVDGLDEIVWWVLSMGPHCRVVKPTDLADRVRDLAAGVVAMYAAPAQGGAKPTVSRTARAPAAAEVKG